MWLSQLALVSYRNFDRLGLTPGPGVLVFAGRNGQGKSNLLEAIYVLATSRSPRTSVERELLSWRPPPDPALAAVVQPFARLEARVRRTRAEVHLELTFEGERLAAPPGLPGGSAGPVSRSIRVNGLPTRATGLVGQLPVVYFSPADVELAGGPPAGRRQYLNLANSQVSPGHLRALQRYNRVLQQRNQALRLVRERRQPVSALEPWTEQLLDWGALVLQQRLAMLAQLEDRVGELFRDLAGSSEMLRVQYRGTVELPPDAYAASLTDLRAMFQARQAQLATREIDQAVSLVGPHRDDFAFRLDDIDLTTYGSRGQQRLAVLALKLAEADWMAAEVGELPVVLLDDVLSELDPARRAFVLRRVAAPDPAAERQVWITTTEPADGLGLDGNAQWYQIDAGRVRQA